MSAGSTSDPDWPMQVREAAHRAGVELSATAIEFLAGHARRVLDENAQLHLTTLVETDAFVERHLVESLLGARAIPADAAGALLDVGSGNGFPGLAVAAARPLLEPYLAEVRQRKADFLGAAIERLGRGALLHRQVQRPADLGDCPPFRVIVSRAMGGWERILPRLLGRLTEDGQLIVWAGAGLEEVRKRKAWRGLQLRRKLAIPGRDRSAIWVFDRLSA